MENKTNYAQEDRVSHACGQKYILMKTQFDGKKPSALSLILMSVGLWSFQLRYPKFLTILHKNKYSDDGKFGYLAN